MASIKRVFAALGLAGVAALTQTGCDNGKELTGETTQNPMVYAMEAKCPANPTESQKIDCVAEATNQSTYLMSRIIEDDAADPTNIIGSGVCQGRIDADVPNSLDVRLQIQASDARNCLSALEEAAPAEKKTEVKTIAQGVKQGLARAGL